MKDASKRSKGKSKTRSSTGEETAGGVMEPPRKKPPRLTQRQRAKLAQETRDEVYRKAADMIAKMIAEVTKKGNHTTAKFLFDFAGIDQIPLNEKQRKQAEDSLAALLLRELQEKPARSETDLAENCDTKLHLTH